VVVVVVVVGAINGVHMYLVHRQTPEFVQFCDEIRSRNKKWCFSKLTKQFVSKPMF
jgi:hypothetical protein